MYILPLSSDDTDSNARLQSLRNDHCILHFSSVGRSEVEQFIFNNERAINRQSMHQVYIFILFLTRNAFCGTWYLPHSQVYSERIVPMIMARCIVHARIVHISSSALKSDVTIVFLDLDFL